MKNDKGQGLKARLVIRALFDKKIPFSHGDYGRMVNKF